MSSAARGARRWRFASGFCAVVTFTVVIGYYVPLRREAIRLRAERAKLELDKGELKAALETSQRELSAARNAQAEMARDVEKRNEARVETEERATTLKQSWSTRFSREHRAKQLTVASAGDRVSIAIDMPVLFPKPTLEMAAQGRTLLCEVAKTIMAEFGGQIRVTGYYGKPSVTEPELARRHATPWELSAVRAAAAVDVLERSCGAPAQRFLVVGYGPRAAGPLGENLAFELVLADAD